MKFKVWVVPWQMELVDHLLKPYGEFEIKNFKTFPLKAAQREDWDGGPVALNQMAFNTHTRNRVSMIDYAFGCLLDAKPESMAERNYPTAAPLGPREIAGDYVVFPVGATSLNKLFRAEVMAPIVRWCLNAGLRPVLVGTKTSHTHTQVGSEVSLKPVEIIDEVDKLPPHVLKSCLDWREKTTLLQLRDVLGHAKAVVGTDGGSLHLAGTTDTNIVFASGTTLPKHRYIPRNADPSHKIRYVGPRDLECAGCQSRMIMMPGHDFRNCIYQDNKCMDMLHPDDFINGLKEMGL
jgi:ADP-heptose:LPS heptosyltransferase